MTTPPITALDREAAALLPCPNPWCSSHRPDPFGYPYIQEYTGGYYRVRCGACPQIGPHGDTEAAAIAAWNSRTAAERATSPAGDAGEVERWVSLARETLAGHPDGKSMPDLALAWLANRAELHASAVLRLAALRPRAGDADVVGEPGA